MTTSSSTELLRRRARTCLLASARRSPGRKDAVVGVKDRDSNEVRAEVVRQTARRCKALSASTPSRARRFDAAAYRGMPEFEHEAVNHTGICPGSGAHQWRVFLVDAQEIVPQDVSEASATLRLRIRFRAIQTSGICPGLAVAIWANRAASVSACRGKRECF